MSRRVSRTLLAIHAHPDDETITTGGTLARYSAEGVRTVVVSCTSGSLGRVGDPGLLRGDGVAGLRARELDAACARLGVSRLERLGYADSGMIGWPENNARCAFHAAPLEDIADRLVAIIERERPQVVISYDHTGGYGHPDHVKAHAATLAAFERSGAARPAKLYFVRFPLSWSREFVRALRAEGIDAPGSAPGGANAGADVHEIGVADDVVTTAVDVGAYVSVKRAALRAHASQMPPDQFLMRMSDTLAMRLWAYEHYSREAGPTAAAPGTLESDLFSGLD